MPIKRLRLPPLPERLRERVAGDGDLIAVDEKLSHEGLRKVWFTFNR
jgi:hypothetical protein